MTFTPGQEVTIVRRGSIQPGCTHVTVSEIKAAGRMVVLDDGSKWTQRGDKWGSTRVAYRYHQDTLYPRAEGLQREADIAADQMEQHLRREMQKHLSAIGSHRKPGPAALTAARALVAWLESVTEGESQP